MKKKNPTREDIIQILKEAATEGKQPSNQILKQKGINGYWVGKLIPEGLTALKLEHGLRVIPQEQHYSSDELLVKIDNVVSELERVPTWTKLREKTGITDKVFIRHFGKKGIREIFIHYRNWLTEYNPKSKNIILVDAYLNTPNKTNPRAKLEIHFDDRPRSVNRYKSHCDHCGNETYKSQIISHEAKKDLVVYRLYECEICEHVVLQSEFSKFTPTLGTIRQKEQLWPSSLMFPQEVPERVRKIYAEAKSIKRRSPSSFVVQIRRALEAVMKERNAKGRELFDQINWLIQNKHLPEVFGEMGHIARLIAKLGAHDKDIDAQPSDADIVDDLFWAIIEYIYIAPAKVAQIKASRHD